MVVVKAVRLKLTLVLGGLLFGVGCGSSGTVGAEDQAGPSAMEILLEQQKIAEYYKSSYKGTYVTNASTGKVEQLLLMNAPLTDLGADRISKLTDLQVLNLVNTKISDKGLAHVSVLTNLTKLQLSRNNITDAGVQHLRNLGKLQKLDLSYTRVADEGLMQLGELPSLNYLLLKRARVTPRGRDRFEKTPVGRRAGFTLVN